MTDRNATWEERGFCSTKLARDNAGNLVLTEVLALARTRPNVHRETHADGVYCWHRVANFFQVWGDPESMDFIEVVR